MGLPLPYDQLVAQSLPPDASVGTTRFEAFSDGVFAIAITLLVLEITVPPGHQEHLLAVVLDQWPSYLAYVVSFATIGAMWILHVTVTEHLVRANPTLLRLNLLLLLFIGFIPFPTRLVAEHARQPDSERVAATLFGLTLLATNAMMITLWRYAVAAQLLHADADAERIQATGDKLAPGLGFYVAALGLGLFLPVIAVLVYLAIAMYFLLPWLSLSRLRRRRTRVP